MWWSRNSRTQTRTLTLWVSAPLDLKEELPRINNKVYKNLSPRIFHIILVNVKMPHCSERPGCNTLCFICEIGISAERTKYRNVQTYSVIAIINPNCFSTVLSSFLSHLSSSTSCPFPTGSSFFFLCYDRGRENWSKKSSFKKHPRLPVGMAFGCKAKVLL